MAGILVLGAFMVFMCALPLLLIAAAVSKPRKPSLSREVE